MVKGASIKGQDNMSRYRNISIKQCNARCQLTPGCSMFEYNEEHNRCDLTNITHSDHNLTANIYGWDYYSLNDGIVYLVFPLLISCKFCSFV